MGDLAGMGRMLVGVAFILLLVGLALMAAPRLPWLGRLPGDFAITRGNFSCWFPLVTSLLLSLVLTIGLNLLLWLLRRLGDGD